MKGRVIISFVDGVVNVLENKSNIKVAIIDIDRTPTVDITTMDQFTEVMIGICNGQIDFINLPDGLEMEIKQT